MAMTATDDDAYAIAGNVAVGRNVANLTVPSNRHLQHNFTFPEAIRMGRCLPRGQNGLHIKTNEPTGDGNLV